MAPVEYDKRDFDKGPATYTDKGFLDKIFKATGLSGHSDKAYVIDLMTGPGKVAFGMQERAPQHDYVVLDNNQEQLDKIIQPTDKKHITKLLGDVKNLSVLIAKDGFFHVATVRYGLKDIPEEQQTGVLKGIFNILRPGGKLVIVDMVSPEGMREWNNRQHGLKQQFNGRNIEKEGECNIPTEAEWSAKLREAGFEPKVSDYYKSLVATKDWVTGRQITSEQRSEMDNLILSAPEDVKIAFNIRQENGDVRIDYPVIIIEAIKVQRSKPVDVYVAK